MLETLIELKFTDRVETYEIYSGDWVKVFGLSANAYWHTYEHYTRNLSEFDYVDRRCKMVLASGRYVGHWNSYEEVVEFFSYYMRAEVQFVVHSKENK